MERARKKTSYFGFFYFCGAATLASYFGFAAMQGQHGMFRQIELTAEERRLESELAEVSAEVEMLRNKTRRLSDDFLDLDLLDERARDMLGMVRADEIVIQ